MDQLFLFKIKNPDKYILFYERKHTFIWVHNLSSDVIQQNNPDILSLIVQQFTVVG